MAKTKYKAKKIEGKTRQVHRLVFEKYAERKLTKQEVVHHIDGDKSNNHIFNLMLFPTKSAHAKYHTLQGDYKLKSGENKKKLVNGKLQCSQCGESKTLEYFQKRKTAHLGVVGVCLVCRNEEVRKYKIRKKMRTKID